MSDRQTWAGVAVEIGVLSRLQPGWDSYGGLPPPPAVVEKALKWARLLELLGVAAPDAVVACSDGGIQFEWYHPVRELEIGPAETAVLVELPDKPVEEWWEEHGL